jgi:hypothetical protein
MGVAEGRKWMSEMEQIALENELVCRPHSNNASNSLPTLSSLVDKEFQSFFASGFTATTSSPDRVAILFKPRSD